MSEVTHNGYIRTARLRDKHMTLEIIVLGTIPEVRCRNIAVSLTGPQYSPPIFRVE